MVQFNERKEKTRAALQKSIAGKLEAIDRWQTKDGSSCVTIWIQDPDDGQKRIPFSAFEKTWRQQGLSLEKLDYGDELTIVYWENKSRDGKIYNNFTEVHAADEHLPF